MKNPHYEYLGRRMREYHRTHQWGLSKGGLYIPHAYWHMTETSLSFFPRAHLPARTPARAGLLATLALAGPLALAQAG